MFAPVAAMTARERVTLLAAATLPVVALLLLRLGGPVRLIQYGVAGVVACAVAAVVFARPRLGVYFMAAYVYSGLGVVFPVPVAVPMMALLTAAVLYRFMRGDANQLVDRPFVWSFALFALLGLQSMLFAHNPGQSLLRIGMYAKTVALTYLIVQLVRTPGQMRLLAVVIFGACVATVVLGFFATRFGLVEVIHYESGVRVLRFSGLHTGPNKLAAYLCAGLPFGVFLVARGEKRWWRMVSLAGVVVCTTGIFATFSRAAIFPFGVVALGVLFYELRSRRAYGVVVALLVIGLLVTPRYYWDRLTSITQVFDTVQRDWSILLRLRAMATAWDLFTQNPLTGIGLGNFQERSAYALVKRVVVHNSYLEVLVSTGVVGLLAFIAVLGTAARHTIDGARARWIQAPAWMRSLSFYAGISFASALTSAMFASISARYLLWIPLACCLIAGNILRREAAAGPGDDTAPVSGNS